MEETLKNWSDQIIPWLTNHGIRIVIIAILALVINRLLKRLIIRAVRTAVKSDKNTPPDAEKKREDTLIRIFTGALNIIIIIVAVMMIVGELGIEIGPLIAGAGIVGLAVGFGGQYPYQGHHNRTLP